LNEWRFRAGDGFHLLGQLNHGELAGVAEVDRAGEVVRHVHQTHKAFDQVVHIAKRAGLRAVAVEGDGLALQRLDDEVAHHAAVIGVHARAVGVEDASDLDVHAVLAAVVKEQGFGAALALVVAGARADRVDLAPVAFGLRMDFGVAVDLAGGGLKDLFAPVRLASPSMLIAPCTLVLVVCTGSC